MKIIGSLTSPYVRKVRIVFLEKKLEAALELENVWDAKTKIGSLNPLGKVPCLILDDGEAIYDSRVIVEYVDTLSPVGKLIPTESRERATVKTWEALADGIMDAGILARLEATWRPAEQQSQAWIERQMGKVDAALSQMSQELGENAWCHGNGWDGAWRHFCLEARPLIQACMTVCTEPSATRHHGPQRRQMM